MEFSGIKTKSDLRYYLDKDREVMGVRKLRIYNSPVWKYVVYLRYTEYYTNRGGGILTNFWRGIGIGNCSD